MTIHAIQHHIRTTYPIATIEVTPPLRSTGVWHLDVRYGSHMLVIQWSEAIGFGVSSLEAGNNYGYGEGPDWVSRSGDETIRRVDELLNRAGAAA